MDVSNCPECKKALKRALLKGEDPSKLKMKDGHLPGCPTLSPPKPATPKPQEGSKDDTYPWSEAQYKIVPSPRPEPSPDRQHAPRPGGDGTQRDVPAGGDMRGTRAVGTARPRPPQVGSVRRDRPLDGHPVRGDRGPAQRSGIQQFKAVDHANSGERKSQLKGAWFPVLVVGMVISGIFFPPLALVFAGAIAMLFLIR